MGEHNIDVVDAESSMQIDFALSVAELVPRETVAARASQEYATGLHFWASEELHRANQAANAAIDSLARSLSGQAGLAD